MTKTQLKKHLQALMLEQHRSLILMLKYDYHRFDDDLDTKNFIVCRKIEFNTEIPSKYYVVIVYSPNPKIRGILQRMSDRQHAMFDFFVSLKRQYPTESCEILQEILKGGFI